MNIEKILLSCGILGVLFAFGYDAVYLAFKAGTFYGFGRSQGNIDMALLHLGANPEDIVHAEDCLTKDLPNTFEGKILKKEAEKGFRVGKQGALTYEMEHFFDGEPH